MRILAALTSSIACIMTLLTAVGCDTISSDFSQFSQSFAPPSPAEAARWAADPNDRENARRGTILLANAPWGGTEAYVKMYRLYAQDALDPLVRAAALQALGRHGDPEDAQLVAKSLTSPFRQARLAAAKALQRLHDPAVADLLWTRLVDVNEESDVRIEIAIALGQYPTPAVFNALVAALSQRELAVNIAAVDALRMLTGQDIGIDEDGWLTYMATAKDPLLNSPTYLYPTFVRELDIWDTLVFWDPVVFESPDVPIGMKVFGVKRTSALSGENAQDTSDSAVPALAPTVAPTVAPTLAPTLAPAPAAESGK